MAIKDEYYLTHQEINSLRTDAKQASAFCRALFLRNIYLKNYHYFVEWSEQKQKSIGLCSEFPMLSYLDNDTQLAISGIKELIENITKKNVLDNVPLPIPLGFEFLDY